MKLVVLALVCALIGAGAATAVVLATGSDEGAATTSTVVVSPPPVPASAKGSAAPQVANGFDAARIYAQRAEGVVTIYAYFGAEQTAVSQGSGFVVSPDGYVLTNSHVITNAGEGTPVAAATQVYVEFADGDRVAGEVVGWDVFDDVGLIKVDPGDRRLAPVPLGDSRAVVVGEPVAAIGSPFGNATSLTVGVVSATHRSIESLTSTYDLPDAIQIDAPINHGNSGGPLFDADGRVVGINAQIRTESGNGEGVGFAIPINAAKRSMRELIERGRVSYAYVGIQTEDLTPSVARHLGYPVARGAVIASVKPDSPAERAGLRGGTDEELFLGKRVSSGGDVIVAIAGVPVRAADDVVRIAAERLRPGQSVPFTILRDGKRRQVTVRLGERRPNPES